VCDHLTDPQYTDKEDNVQRVASRWEFYDTLAYEVIGMAITILYGSISDRYTRKLPLILLLLGQMVSTLLYLVNSVYI
jgi:sugar phosphate permease